MQRFYLDDNATTTLDPRVRAVMEPLLAGAAGQSLQPSRRRPARARRDRCGPRYHRRVAEGEDLRKSFSPAAARKAATSPCRDSPAPTRARAGISSPRRRSITPCCTPFRRLEARKNFEVTYLDVDADGPDRSGRPRARDPARHDPGLDHEREQRDRRPPADARDRRNLREARRSFPYRCDPKRGQGSRSIWPDGRSAR